MATLSLQHISKAYPGVKALDDVSIDFERGEIHSIMGENGAGKSTLIKIISGAVQSDSGTVTIDGEQLTKITPALAKGKGIGVIYQEFYLVPSLSVAENVFLGSKTGNPVMPDFKQMRKRTDEIMAEFGVKINSRKMVGELPTSQQQLVEIAKAISQNCRVLILDEPSAAIGVAEVKVMFKIIRQLKEKGVTIVYISHRMDEVFEISDRVTVLRDGKFVATKRIGEVSRQSLITMMVGRELTETYPKREVNIGDTVLEVKNLTGNGDVDISFNLRRGEILGFAGLVGAGRTELAKMLFGDVKPVSGEILVKSKRVSFTDTSSAIAHGIGLIPEDRKKEGAFLGYTIHWNIPCMSLRRISKLSVINKKEANHLTAQYVERLGIKTPSVRQLVGNLSGGNQQKVVVAKVLAAKTDILIFDEPTRGIDVGAKQEIYRLMNELAEQGMSIIMITSEMEELLGMSDRVIVLFEGKITGELAKEEFAQERVLELASGM
jgi:ABC-type sugar transport system ATPase subunit